MHGGVSSFLRLLNLPARKRLALVLVVFVLSVALLGLCWLEFPGIYFSWLLLFPLLCAAWLFGWRAGSLCLAGLTVALVASDVLNSGGLTWPSSWLALLLAQTLCGLVVCLLVEALRSVARSLLAERQHAVRLQQAYERELALNEWKDQALQDLNHELRIPLTQTDGYLELLETYRDDLDTATRAQFIALARGGCDDLLNLIRTTIEKLQDSEMEQPVHMSVFALRHEIHAALAHCDSRLLQDHPVNLDIADSVYVCADARFVRQVMRNLLTNACKYTPAGTPIVVSAARVNVADCPHAQAGMICVRVRDSGPGIPPDQHVRVFERFARLSNSVTQSQPGSGLGLAICKQLVETMGGTIWVESTGRNGEGSCFSFTLASGSQSSALDSIERIGEDDGKVQARLQSRQESFAVPALW